MTTVFLLAGLFVLAILALAFLAFVKKSRQPTIAYTHSKPLTEPEQTLYWRLLEALPECVILSQVTFSRIMKPDAGPGTANYRSLQNRIAQKTADFVVVLKDFTIVTVIELDDGSHNAAKDLERDRLLAAAGIQVIRFDVRELPTVARIREAIAGSAKAPLR